MNGKIYKQNIVFPIPNMVYVAENGNDVTGDGSLSRPFASINAAMASIGSDPTTISLAAGTYTGAPVAWKGNVSLVGSGASTTSIQNLLSYTAPAAGEETFTFWGVSVANPFDFDFALANQAVVFLNEGGYSPNRVDTTPPGPRFLFINNSTIGEFSCAGTIVFNSCIFLGGPNEIQDGGTVLMNGCTVGVTIDLYATGALQVVSCIFPGSVVGHIVGLDTPTLFTDSPSRAQMASVTDVAVVLTDDAKYNAYIPTTPGNWLVPPTIVQEGLDELAERATANSDNTFVYRPGGVQEKNVYTSFTDLATAVALVEGPKIVEIDDSITSPAVIPAGTHTLQDVTLVGLGLVVQTQCQIADGGVLVGVSGMARSLDIESVSDTPVIAFSGGDQNIFRLSSGVTISASGLATFFNVSGAGTLLFIAAADFCQLGVKSVTVDASATSFSFAGSVGSIFSTDALEGDGIANGSYDASTSISLTQTSFSGTFTTQAKDSAASVEYVPDDPADWISPPEQVAEALDELAGRIPTSGHDDTQVGSRGAPVAITAVGGIPFTSTTLFTSIYVEGDGTPVIISANPQIAAGSFVGQKLRIFFCDDVNTVAIANGTGTDMNGNIAGGTNDAIEYEWDGANWYETWRRG